MDRAYKTKNKTKKICVKKKENEDFYKKVAKKFGGIKKNSLPLHSLWNTKPVFKTFGEVVEWSITAVLKTAVLRGTGGSNPSLSALGTARAMLQFFFCPVFGDYFEMQFSASLRISFKRL